jgi:hypothetical protein
MIRLVSDSVDQCIIRTGTFTMSKRISGAILAYSALLLLCLGPQPSWGRGFGGGFRGGGGFGGGFSPGSFRRGDFGGSRMPGMGGGGLGDVSQGMGFRELGSAGPAAGGFRQFGEGVGNAGLGGGYRAGGAAGFEGFGGGAFRGNSSVLQGLEGGASGRGLGGAAGFARGNLGQGGLRNDGALTSFRDARPDTVVNQFATPNRGQLNSFLGLPSDEGLHSLSAPRGGDYGLAGDFNVQHGVVEGPRGGYAAGISVVGPRGNEAGKGIAVVPNGGVAAGRGAKGADGGDVGQATVAGPGGRVVGGTAIRGADANAAARGFAENPRGFAAGSMRVTPSGRYTTAVAVRGNFAHTGIYGDTWYAAHPGAWYAAGWAAGEAYTAASWDALGAWMSYEATQPIYYDYGNNVVYQGDNVYVNGQDSGTSTQYYDSAAALAQTGSEAQAPPQQEWLPLGVFALCKPGNPNSDVVLQLALNKQGIIRGNSTDTQTNKTQPIEGSVDKQSQRVAFTVGDNRSTVLETGLYNLTKAEAPALIHLGSDRTEQWLLVRLKQSDGQPQQPQSTEQPRQQPLDP